MPRSSWGTKTKVSKNKWRIRWCEWDGRDRVRKSKTLYPCTSREADDELRRLWQLHHLRPDEREVPCPTFAQCWEDWYAPQLETQVEKGELALSTRKNYTNLWRSNIAPRWADTPMDRVDSTGYQLWLNSLTPSIARLANITVGNMVNCARLHRVEGITFRDIRYRLPKARRDGGDGELEVYTLPELHVLFNEAAGKPYESVVLLMGAGSCRVGEAAAAAVVDVSFEVYNGHLYAVYDLHRQFAHGKDGFIPLKTPESKRPVVVAEPWSIRLRDIAKQRTADGELYMADSGTGSPMPRDMINRLWRTDFKAGEYSVRYLPMTKLRNSWATAMLWKHDVPSQMVDKMMGHAAKNILGRNYDRPDKQMFIEAVDRALFGK